MPGHPPRTSRAATAPSTPPAIPPPPRAFIAALAVHAVEVLEGSRPFTQLRGRLSTAAAEQLLFQRQLRAERRAVHRDRRRIVPHPGSVFTSEPRPGAVEASVTVYVGRRAIAVAMRLELTHGRWRAEVLGVM